MSLIHNLDKRHFVSVITGLGAASDLNDEENFHLASHRRRSRMSSRGGGVLLYKDFAVFIQRLLVGMSAMCINWTDLLHAGSQLTHNPAGCPALGSGQTFWR